MIEIPQGPKSIADVISNGRGEFDGRNHQLSQLLIEADHVHLQVLEVLSRHGLTETEVLEYLHETPRIVEGQLRGWYTPAEVMTWKHRDLKTFAEQYEHVRKVTAATLALKTQLLELELPDRIVAYQTGTGWPLPDTSTGQIEEVVYIPYGTGALSEFCPPGLYGDGVSGIHVYRVTSTTGEPITLLAVKGRMHAYTETERPVASHDLAFMPRLLKGVGTEFMLSTFASGGDRDAFLNDENGSTGAEIKREIKPHDLGVILTGADDSLHASFHGPGSGDQRILGSVYGGPFQNVAAMLPEAVHIRHLQAVLAELQNKKYQGRTDFPSLWPAAVVDTQLSPQFQTAWTQAATHPIWQRMIELGTLPDDLLELFDSPVPMVAHGMGQMTERTAYFQQSADGPRSAWNRRLPELAVVTVTDLVDPRVGGQSHTISDDVVRASAREVEEVMARIVSQFFIRYAS